MSIWSSVGGEPILALNGAGESENYRAEGTPSIVVDVATTGHHDGTRLAAWDDAGVDLSLVFAPGAARELRDRLTAALDGRGSDG